MEDFDNEGCVFSFCFNNKMEKGSSLNKVVSLSPRDTVQGILTCGPWIHVHGHICTTDSRTEEGTVARSQGQTLVSAKEVPLLLNQGPEMTKALISCIGSSREWSFLDGHAQPHSLGFGEKRRICVFSGGRRHRQLRLQE